MINKHSAAACGEKSEPDTLPGKKYCFLNASIFSGRTLPTTSLKCNMVSIAITLLCFTGLVLNIFSYDNGNRSSIYIMTDDLCKEADSDDSDKSQLSRMDASFVSEIPHIKQNLSLGTRIIIPDLLSQTFLLYSLPAGRSPPC